MKCPYCAEKIKDEAIVCRYCHRELTSVRLNLLEESVKKRLDTIEIGLHNLEKRVNDLSSAGNILQPSPISQEVKIRLTWTIFILVFLIGCVGSIGSIYTFLKTGSPQLLLFPFFLNIAVGVWLGFTELFQSVKKYAIVSFGIGIVELVGIIIVINEVIYNYSFPRLVLAALGNLVFNFRNAWVVLLLFATPFFLVLLGSFLGEWLESIRPSGRRMTYPDEIASQVVRLSSSANSSSDVDFDRLSKLLAALAPLIAAIGGIVVPIITLFIAG